MNGEEKSALHEICGSSFRDIADLGSDRAGTEAILSWLQGEDVTLPPVGRSERTLTISSAEELLYPQR